MELPKNLNEFSKSDLESVLEKFKDLPPYTMSNRGIFDDTSHIEKYTTYVMLGLNAIMVLSVFTKNIFTRILIILLSILCLVFFYAYSRGQTVKELFDSIMGNVTPGGNEETGEA